MFEQTEDYNNKSEIISLNFDEKIRKMETLINLWSQRKLSLKGKVTILKSSTISQVSHLLSE